MEYSLPRYVTISVIWIILGTAVAFAIATWLGYLRGRRTHNVTDSARSQIGALQAASLGLLALLLGFSFAMAGSRYDRRREIIVNEANAIGTTALRAQLMPQPHADRILGLLRGYVDRRVEFFAAGQDLAAATQAELETLELQQRLWNEVVAITQVEKTPIVAAFISALNDTIDLQGIRLAAIEDHVPPPIIWLLILAGIGAMAITGYASGVSGMRTLYPAALAGLMVICVIYVTLDLDRPRVGFVTVGQNSMLRLQKSLRDAAPAGPAEAGAIEAPPAAGR